MVRPSVLPGKNVVRATVRPRHGAGEGRDIRNPPSSLNKNETSVIRKSHVVKGARRLKLTAVRNDVERRMSDFRSFSRRPGREWFSELCFCILTANSRARSAIAIQQELGAQGFLSCGKEVVCSCIMRHKHRFHNTKTGYILEARRHRDIKKIIMKLEKNEGVGRAREWLVENVKGLGYKEASHYLRNVGYDGIAILDRHILNLLADDGIIERKKSGLQKSAYLQIEGLFKKVAQEAGMTPIELDLYMWYMKTGEVLK